ncbi:RNA polymerase recycling motor ATPase HelR [Cellulomonas timonensis]|uniref:RNA polymerase recycling motor ATPase HelR n=1 Tax=Cellulomonas timonensis TaxID=1689271 RepID=UPI000830896A|nr:RNA polymerase recycling motor ATPase HelR [Cellulomonas timonensis]
MNPVTLSVFDLPDRLAAKADPALVAADARHLAAVVESLDLSIQDLSHRLDVERRAPGGRGQEALARDQEVHRLTARLRALRRFGADLCLGRMVGADDPEPVYVGRLGLADSSGRRLLVDWRSPAAEPFFAATHAHPMGLTSRRRYRWTGGRVSDYWDEVFDADGAAGIDHHPALDDQSAFIASLGAHRSARMRDVLGTIQADQDAIIRADSRSALVVDGGPGTGKTVVALHRAAYLLYSDPRLGHRRGGLLFVGPHEPYLAYVADVLPSLGEEGVLTCTMRDLVAEGAAAAVEADPEVARLKSSAQMVDAIEAAVRFSERPPTEGMTVTTPWADVWLSAGDWAEAFEAPEPGIPHNEAREQVRDALIAILRDKHDLEADDPHDDEAAPGQVRESLRRDPELRAALHRAWPLLEPAEIVGDLWSVPAYLRLCAPWLSVDEVRALQRADAQVWTVSDLPLLDAARRRLGDPGASLRAQRHEAVVAAERARMADVIGDLIEADDSTLGVMHMLRGDDLQAALVDGSSVPGAARDPLAGPFAHIVVDEAQELTDAEWQMLLRRCPSRSLTIVGDRAQARHGFIESWHERLARIGLDGVDLASLSINYRTPQEVMAAAEPVIRSVLPDANVPTSIRRTGVPVMQGSTRDLDAVLDDWLAAHAGGTACVMGAPAHAGSSRVRSLTPELSKGLEFDLVVLVDPEAFGEGAEGAVDRYVAMTRATRQLVILTPDA